MAAWGVNRVRGPDPRLWPLTGASPRACGLRRWSTGHGCGGVEARGGRATTVVRPFLRLSLPRVPADAKE
jgi:hypothetical protein